MKIAIACLLAAFPMLALADTVSTKDKYIDCNCHITPSISSKNSSKTTSVHKTKKHSQKTVTAFQNTKASVSSGTVVLSSAKSSVVIPHKKPITMHPDYTGDAYPGHDNIISSNKLALPAGKAAYAAGELVYISGRVLDKKCVPVSDAVVEIWQTNPEGQYEKTTLSERLSPAPTFTGSGRATTDNLGRFNFVTIFPGTVGARAPFIHVHVAHKDFPTINTEMFFGDDRRNQDDQVLNSVTPEQRRWLTARVWQRDVNNPDKGLAASWDISLDGINSYRHF